MEKDYSLLVLSAVAIIAVVGLVMPFGAADSGAVYFEPWSIGNDGETGYNLGIHVANSWTKWSGDQPTYCSVACGNACREAFEQRSVSQLGGDCYLNCESNCGRILLQQIGVTR